MACNSCASDKSDANNDPKWRRALWIALVVNATMFVAEMVAGVAGGSKALQADALDFLGDAANYAISLGVAPFLVGDVLKALVAAGCTSTVWAALNGRRA